MELNLEEKNLLEEKLKALIITDAEIDTDPLIKNPFIGIDSKWQTRISLDKHPINKVGNVDYINYYQNEDGSVELDNQLDPKLNYFLGVNEYENKNINMIYPIDSDCLDYTLSPDVLNNGRTDGKQIHTQHTPLSFLNIKSEEEGLLWYKKHYPKIPDDLLPIIARYHWGDKLNNKTIKKENKRNKKKLIKAEKSIGLQIRITDKDNPFLISFD
jgi:hypothetical protein